MRAVRRRDHGSMGVVFGKISEELPKHSVVATAANFTVRHYEPSIAAMCDYRSGWGSSSDGTPFGALARYIGVFSTPENTAAKKEAPEPISMTAPVLIDPTRNTHTMMFLLPASKYKSIETAPKPLNPSVRLQELPARLMAVRQFNGSTSAGLKSSVCRSFTDLMLVSCMRVRSPISC